MSQMIVLEGPDGVGKTTVAMSLASELKEAGGEPLVVAFPGNDPETLGRLVYDLHHGRIPLSRPIAAAAIQVLHVAAHIDAIESVIKTGLESGRDIVLDRYWWSTVAYGGLDGAIRPELLNDMVQLEQQVWGPARPDLIVLLAPVHPYQVHLPASRYHALLAAYRDLVDASTDPVLVIDRRMPVRAITQTIFQRLK